MSLKLLNNILDRELRYSKYNIKAGMLRQKSVSNNLQPKPTSRYNLRNVSSDIEDIKNIFYIFWNHFCKLNNTPQHIDLLRNNCNYNNLNRLEIPININDPNNGKILLRVQRNEKKYILSIIIKLGNIHITIFNNVICLANNNVKHSLCELHFTFENIITPPNLSSFTAADNRLRLYIEWNYWDDVYMSFSDREVELKIIDKLTTITYDIMYYLNYGRNRIRTTSPSRLLRELYLHRDLLINQETINNLRDFAGLLQYITFLYKGGKKK